jgi:CheY-like chemotaxis protein
VETAPFSLEGKKQAEVKFTAPDAHVLAVDDIETNLTVLSGLLAPYRMRLTLCTSGEEAVTLVKNRSFDFVLMDHMMPGMDGVEAVAQIRKWEESRQTLAVEPLENPVNPHKRIPIIALTANAVSGMRAMFLEQGFDDFLSKPIEIAKLDELIAKWTPAEKKLTIRGEEPGGADRGKERIEALPVIPGLDTAKGIAFCGGTVAAYKKVLSMFRRDAAERLLVFTAIPAEGELATFAAQAHAIKSAAGTIGAAELSEEAAELEAAGKAGDTQAIHETLPLFHEHLIRLIEVIENFLEGKDEGTKTGSGKMEDLTALLSALKPALKTKEMKEIDRLLEEIEQLSLDARTRKAINAVSDKVLMGEYGGAIENVNILLAAKEY